jgi:hypothetical protein
MSTAISEKLSREGASHSDEGQSVYEDLWLDPERTAQALGVTRDHLYKITRRGDCPVRSKKFGHLLRFYGPDLRLEESK